jgi:hypothetical protein
MRISPTCDTSQQRNGDSPIVPGGPEPERTDALTAEEQAKLDRQRESMAHARAARWKDQKKRSRRPWRASVEQAARWAAAHDPDPRTLERAKGLKRTLLELKRDSPAQFMRILLPLLPSPAPAASEPAAEQAEGYDKANEALAEWMRLCEQYHIRVGMSVATIQAKMGDPDATEEVPPGKPYEEEFKTPLDAEATYRVLRFVRYPTPENNGSDRPLHRLNILARDGQVVVGFRQYSDTATYHPEHLPGRYDSPAPAPTAAQLPRQDEPEPPPQELHLRRAEASAPEARQQPPEVESVVCNQCKRLTPPWTAGCPSCMVRQRDGLQYRPRRAPRSASPR